ncbi:acetoacetate decarboxylase family protein [Nocardioides sp. JQ2195]|uniref:acetoacetate decarboxylase family protein n=1 Tax=Nocardioides sp. JQ2195 TaxID=2592334 RepID=UPI00143E81F6|nr:acetoacetate decarboxylase family protein [Nocardioides sp. JQ2195]QIX26885.1 acetoacetate decarboxylase family protein [Nocardioides sp. JQ2195]
MPLDLAAVSGVRETALDDALVTSLPENTAPAPWTVRASAVVWWSRATPEATDALPPSLRDRARAAVVVGGMVRYADTPVGVYDEVFGAIGFRRGRRFIATIPFMAVDSPSSLVGGRDNWAIPKALADFTGSPGAGSCFTAQSASGPGWKVSAAPTAKGPRLPVFSRAMVAQEFPDGSLRGTRLQARGRMRLASSMVTVDSDHGLPSWLTPGRHRGAVITGTTFTLGAPEPL